MKSIFLSPYTMKQNRRLQNQQQFIPVNTYSSMQDQQTMPSDQQYGQSLNQPTSKNLKIYIEEKLNFAFCFLASVYSRNATTKQSFLFFNHHHLGLSKI